MQLIFYFLPSMWGILLIIFPQTIIETSSQHNFRWTKNTYVCDFMNQDELGKWKGQVKRKVIQEKKKNWIHFHRKPTKREVLTNKELENKLNQTSVTNLRPNITLICTSVYFASRHSNCSYILLKRVESVFLQGHLCWKISQLDRPVRPEGIPTDEDYL